MNTLKEIFNFWRERFQNNLAQQFLIIFGVTGILLAGVALLVYFSLEEEKVIEPVRQGVRLDRDALSASGEIPWNRFIEDVFTAHGGRAQFERMLTFRKEGVLFYGEDELEVVFAYKRPGMIRYRLLNDQQMSITFSFDGTTAWNQLERTLNPQPARTLQGAEADAVIRNSAASRHFLEFISEGIRPDLRGLTIVDGEEYIEVVMPQVGGMRRKFLFDPETFYVMRHLWTETNADGRTVQMEVAYSDYRVIDGFPCAFAEVVKVDGRELNRFEISGYEVNPGILNAYFQPPAMTQ